MFIGWGWFFINWWLSCFSIYFDHLKQLSWSNATVYTIINALSFVFHPIRCNCRYYFSPNTNSSFVLSFSSKPLKFTYIHSIIHSHVVKYFREIEEKFWYRTKYKRDNAFLQHFATLIKWSKDLFRYEHGNTFSITFMVANITNGMLFGYSTIVMMKILDI